MSELKSALLLQRQEVVQGAAVWTTLAALWGKVTRTGETDRYNRIEKATHEIVVRRRTDLVFESGMRLMSGDSVYFILAVYDEDVARRWVRLIAQNVEAVG